eukprot:scaffold450455_cov79-Attheya_sp.AAC.1
MASRQQQPQPSTLLGSKRARETCRGVLNDAVVIDNATTPLVRDDANDTHDKHPVNEDHANISMNRKDDAVLMIRSLQRLDPILQFLTRATGQPT